MFVRKAQNTVKACTSTPETLLYDQDGISLPSVLCRFGTCKTPGRESGAERVPRINPPGVQRA